MTGLGAGNQTRERVRHRPTGTDRFGKTGKDRKSREIDWEKHREIDREIERGRY